MTERDEPKNPCEYIGLGFSCAFLGKFLQNGGRGRDLIPLHMPIADGVCKVATLTPGEQEQQCRAFKEGLPREITCYSPGPLVDSLTIESVSSLLNKLPRD